MREGFVRTARAEQEMCSPAGDVPPTRTQPCAQYVAQPRIYKARCTTFRRGNTAKTLHAPAPVVVQQPALQHDLQRAVRHRRATLRAVRRNRERHAARRIRNVRERVNGHVVTRDGLVRRVVLPVRAVVADARVAVAAVRVRVPRGVRAERRHVKARDDLRRGLGVGESVDPEPGGRGRGGGRRWRRGRRSRVSHTSWRGGDATSCSHKTPRAPPCPTGPRSGSRRSCTRRPLWTRPSTGGTRRSPTAKRRGAPR